MFALKNTLLFALPLFLFSCTKSEFIEPEGIYHQQVDSLFGAKDGGPLQVDLNNDDIADVEFFVENYSYEDTMNEAFMIKGLNNTELLLANNTYNSVFQSRNIFAPVEGELLGKESAYGNSWDSKKGILASRLLLKGETFSGPLTDEKGKILAVKLSKSGKNYFGWIRTRLNRENVKVLIIDFALNRTPGEGIKAGLTSAH